MQADVKKELAKIEAIETTVPASVTLGLFMVNTTAVRKALVEKHKKIANETLSLIAKKVKQRRLEVGDEYAAIQRLLNRGLTDVEQVAELEEYVQNLPVQLAELQESLVLLQNENGVLDDFQHPTSDDDFRKFYQTLAWPKRIDEEMEHVLEKCQMKREEYALEQQAEQDAFGKQLNKLDKIVNDFGKHTDLAKVESVSKM
eukprot:6866010-Prymnesium_polylepis.1